jgi:DnaJ-class molecular chaperone
MIRRRLLAPEQAFEILGVSRHASRGEIEAAWRRVASKHHPDRGGDVHQMARINAACDALLMQ